MAGNRFPKKMTPEVQQEFSRLMSIDPNQALRPKAIVIAAESPNNPLHKYFTWDDSKAAEQWRLEEARGLIQSFTIYSKEVDSEIRVLTSLDLDRGNGAGYRWTTEVLERPDLNEQYLQTALAELERVRVRYEHVEKLTKVWADIKEASAEHEAQIAKTEKKTQRKAKVKQAVQEVITPKRKGRPPLSHTNGFVAHPA